MHLVTLLPGYLQFTGLFTVYRVIYSLPGYFHEVQIFMNAELLALAEFFTI